MKVENGRSKKILFIGNAANFHLIHLANALKKYSQYPLQIDIMCVNYISQEKQAELASTFDTIYTLGESRVYDLLAKVKIIRTLSYLWQLRRVVGRIDHFYDAIEIHYPDTLYVYLLRSLKRKAKRVFVCLWGNDYYIDRLVNKRKEREFRYLLKNTDGVLVGTLAMQKELLAEFSFLKNKLYEIRFGSQIIDLLRNFTAASNREGLLEKFKIPNDAIVITAGHNAAVEQQHMLMIDALEQFVSLMPDIKVHALFPLSYPNNTGYKDAIKKRLAASKLSFTVFSEFMTEQSVMELRVLSDIFIHIQLVDAFSAAMLEYFYTGCIVINGEWLNYPELEAAGIKYLKVPQATASSLKDVLQDCVTNRAFWTATSRTNTPIAFNLKSWEANVYKWLKVYDEL